MRSPYVSALLLVAAYGAAATPARAQLSIDRLWVDFEPGEVNRADVVIRNESKDRYYITISPSEVVDPGEADEKRVAEPDPQKLGLLVTPNRLVIDPGETRSIRMVSLNSGLTTDRVYRVKVTPQVGDIATDNTPTDNRQIAIKVLAAYDLLVTVRPDHAKADVVARRDPSQIVLTNSGNSNALLYDGAACNADQTAAADSGCAKVGAKRLYAGQQWAIPTTSGDARLHFKEKTLASSEPKDVTF